MSRRCCRLATDGHAWGGMKVPKILFVLLVGVAAMVSPLSAHHSHSAYEVGKLVTMEGVVSDVQWKNPHMVVALDVPAGGGKVDTWVFEVAGTASTVSSGITPRILKVGNKVKIFASPSKDKNKKLALFLGMEYDGKVYARGGRARGYDDEGK